MILQMFFGWLMLGIHPPWGDRDLEHEKVSGVSLVRKRKSKLPFFATSANRAVKDALRVCRSVIQTAAETWRRDLWDFCSLSKHWPNPSVFSGTARLKEGGLLLFLETRVHTVMNKELYSLLIGREWETLSALHRSLDYPPPSIHDEYVSLIVRTQTQHRMKCRQIYGHSHRTKSLKQESTTHQGAGQLQGKCV